MAVDMAISATEKPLGKVFTSDYQLTIPSFQRAYTWQAENIEQLVNDLQDACADPDTPYFLGSLILVKDGPTQYQVIDGQQRLISLSIIVSVLRELEDDPDLIDSLNDLILEPGDKLRGIKAEPRLTLRERDTDFFRMYVQEGDLEGLFDLRDNDIASHAQRNIAVNTRRTFDLLAAMDAKDRRRFASYLVNGVTLVIVTTDDLAGAHRIFDVMNMRGVPLTASDVFKAKTIAEISPAARNAYATRWDDIMDPLGDDSHTLEEFFSDLHLIVSHKAVCTQLLEEFRKDVLKPYVKKQNVISFIDDLLAPYANAWLILNRPTDANLPDDIVAMLVSLADYQTTDWKPVAMWALVNSIRNLGSANAQVFSTPGNIGNETTNAHDERLQLHDIDRLHDVLAALERVTGVDSLNRQSPLATYAQRRDRMLLSASSRRFPLTAELANIAECTPQTLQYRQDEMVRLIADHWNIRYDADDTDLSTLNEETLNVKATASSPTSKRVSIAQVLEAGLLIAGETLVWERPRKGERWVATVTSEGKLRMDDGREYATPTAAARAVGGSSAGLTVWKRTSNGQKLSDVWKAYRLRKH